jgi:hypothetical protein
VPHPDGMQQTPSRAEGLVLGRILCHSC